MKVDLFDYNLPENKIAQAPVRPRERAKMLVYSREADRILDRTVADLPSFIRSGDLLVFNVSKVRHARLMGVRQSDGKEIEALILKSLSKDGQFECLLRGKNIEIGEKIRFDDVHCEIINKLTDGMGRFIIQTNLSSPDFILFCEEFGHLPLPPYIHNPQLAGFEDELYQPITAKILGSVAAPTASLHFSPELLEKLKQGGVKTAEVILHVGLGTFLPVRVENTNDHVMHSEAVEVSQAVIDLIHQTKANGGRVVAVGTTVARALESAGNQPYFGETNLFITPGYRFKVVDCLLTNFHQPKSTLLMLVSALTGRTKLFDLYDHAQKSNYRFLSFGDCMLII
ncbi:MAG: tRNA preQ1(34) S-adenosylmethionine ribosyltransferase-isomerase QueA [Patescibacteria group bacterium]|jgi:S-adenosylmethionine:tRNA ribosyltransferase-isomerase